MHCGCPLPGDTIGQKLAKLTEKLHVSLSDDTTSNTLVPPNHPDAPGATHPSDHNAIVTGAPSTTGRPARLYEQAKRRERDAKDVKRGKVDPETFKRGHNHIPAFVGLTPVPFYPPAFRTVSRNPGRGTVTIHVARRCGARSLLI